jgi:hypothetical protein
MIARSVLALGSSIPARLDHDWPGAPDVSVAANRAMI